MNLHISVKLKLIDSVLTSMDKKIHTLVDLQMAFDTLDHEILLEKIKCFGFQLSLIKWFESYLSEGNFWSVLKIFFMRVKH